MNVKNNCSWNRTKKIGKCHAIAYGFQIHGRKYSHAIMNMVLSDSGIGQNEHVPVRFWIDLYHTNSKSDTIRDLSDLVTIAF